MNDDFETYLRQLKVARCSERLERRIFGEKVRSLHDRARSEDLKPLVRMRSRRSDPSPIAQPSLLTATGAEWALTACLFLIVVVFYSTAQKEQTSLARIFGNAAVINSVAPSTRDYGDVVIRVDHVPGTGLLEQGNFLDFTSDVSSATSGFLDGPLSKYRSIGASTAMRRRRTTCAILSLVLGSVLGTIANANDDRPVGIYLQLFRLNGDAVHQTTLEDKVWTTDDPPEKYRDIVTIFDRGKVETEGNHLALESGTFFVGMARKSPSRRRQIQRLTTG